MKLKFLIIIMAMCLGNSAFAADYYVATTGSDSNSGTLAAPWLTLQKAINTVSGGDTVFFLAGTYARGNFSSLHPAAGQWITFKPYQTAHVVINTAGGSISFGSANNIILEGFEITDLGYTQNLNNRAAAHGVSPSCDLSTSAACQSLAADLLASGSPALALNSGCRDITFRENEIHHNADHAILGHCNNFQLLNNHIHHNGYAGLLQGYGIYLSDSTNPVVRGNVFHDNTGNNIRLGNGPQGFPNFHDIVESNRVFNARGPFFHSSNGGTVKGKDDVNNIVLWGTSGSIVRNNIVYGSDGLGIWSANDSPSQPNQIYNNVSYGNGTYGILLSRNSNARNNIIWGNAKRISAYELRMTDTHTGIAEYNIVGGSSLSINNQGTGIARNNLLNVDPLLWDPANGDFGLKLLSPALDAGMTLSEVTQDFTGAPRPNGPAYDIGAFEGSGSHPNPAPGGGGGDIGGGSAPCCQ